MQSHPSQKHWLGNHRLWHLDPKLVPDNPTHGSILQWLGLDNPLQCCNSLELELDGPVQCCKPLGLGLDNLWLSSCLQALGLHSQKQGHNLVWPKHYYPRPMSHNQRHWHHSLEQHCVEMPWSDDLLPQHTCQHWPQHLGQCHKDLLWLYTPKPRPLRTQFGLGNQWPHHKPR